MTDKEKLEKEVMERIIIGEQMEIDRLEKENKELREENEQLKQQIVGKENEFKYFSNSFQSKIKELKQQIEQMKCCGNCKHYCINDEDEFDCCRSYNCTKFDKWELAE